MSIHIHSPKGTYFAQIRRPYERTWTEVGSEFTERSSAQAVVGSNMVDDYRYGRVLFCAECYDPVVVMRASR